MGLLDFLLGTKISAAGSPVKPPTELREALLAVNRPALPFVVRDGSPERVDLVAEWHIVDELWCKLFATAGLDKTFKILIRLDADKHEVRAVDQAWSVEWRAGVPSLTLAAEAFRGQKAEVSFGTAYAFTEKLELGEVYRYRFATREIKTPLQDAVTAAGWTWRGVAFGRL